MFEEIMKKQRISGRNMMAQQIQHMWGALQGKALLFPLFRALSSISKLREIKQNCASLF